MPPTGTNRREADAAYRVPALSASQAHRFFEHDDTAQDLTLVTCYVCYGTLGGRRAMCCEVCGVGVHHKCLKKVPADCKPVSIVSAELLTDATGPAAKEEVTGPPRLAPPPMGHHWLPDGCIIEGVEQSMGASADALAVARLVSPPTSSAVQCDVVVPPLQYRRSGCVWPARSPAGAPRRAWLCPSRRRGPVRGAKSASTPRVIWRRSGACERSRCVEDTVGLCTTTATMLPLPAEHVFRARVACKRPPPATSAMERG